jgi:hypothetical protein
MLTFTASDAPKSAIQIAGDALDGDGGTILGGSLLPTIEENIQTATPFRAANAVRFNRGNARCHLTFTVWRKHDNLSDAIGWAQTEPTQYLGKKGTLIHQDQGRRVTYTNAIVRAQPTDRIGIDTMIQYDIQCDPPS